MRKLVNFESYVMLLLCYLFMFTLFSIYLHLFLITLRKNSLVKIRQELSNKLYCRRFGRMTFFRTVCFHTDQDMYILVLNENLVKAERVISSPKNNYINSKSIISYYNICMLQILH